MLYFRIKFPFIFGYFCLFFALSLIYLFRGYSMYSWSSGWQKCLPFKSRSHSGYRQMLHFKSKVREFSSWGKGPLLPGPIAFAFESLHGEGRWLAYFKQVWLSTFWKAGATFPPSPVCVWKDSLGWMSSAFWCKEGRLIKGIKNIFFLISLDSLCLSQTLPDWQNITQITLLLKQRRGSSRHFFHLSINWELIKSSRNNCSLTLTWQKRSKMSRVEKSERAGTSLAQKKAASRLRADTQALRRVCLITEK